MSEGFGYTVRGVVAVCNVLLRLRQMKHKTKQRMIAITTTKIPATILEKDVWGGGEVESMGSV